MKPCLEVEVDLPEGEGAGVEVNLEKELETTEGEETEKILEKEEEKRKEEIDPGQEITIEILEIEEVIVKENLKIAQHPLLLHQY